MMVHLDDIVENIARLGFAMGNERVDDRALDDLLPALSAAESSVYARRKGNDSYALRNILGVVKGVQELALEPVVFQTVRAVLGANARPVKATLFDKTAAVNWNLRWHQDNVIAVKERKEVDGFSAWSVRVGVPHVRPPVEILEQMLAARIHFDDCPADNGALQVMAASHADGRLSAQVIDRWKSRAPVVCVAQRGEILYMRPLLLHSSRPSITPSHRRVLHVEYAGCDLPGGLEWGQ